MLCLALAHLIVSRQPFTPHAVFLDELGEHVTQIGNHEETHARMGGRTSPSSYAPRETVASSGNYGCELDVNTRLLKVVKK